MGKRRRKKRTHVQHEQVSHKTPRSFILERGAVGKTVSQLVLNMRQVMEPYTASKLKVLQRNVLKDFVHIAGPLGVTHFLMFSATSEFTNLKMAKVPHGPTLTFHITQFALSSDVVNSLRKPVADSLQYLAPPLVVLNNFSPDLLPHKLMTTFFQNLFPSINIHTVKLAEIRRCVLFSFDSENGLIHFRHYNIKIAPVGVSKAVKKLAKSKLPDLSKYKDISDFVLRGNVSESEFEDEDSKVTLPQDVPGRGNVKSEQSSVRLTELGPRMSLQLIKIEDGFCEGEVLHHEFIHKTKKEVRKLKKKRVDKRKLKEERRKQQEDNIERKKLIKEKHKMQCVAGQQQTSKSNESEESNDPEESDDETEQIQRQVEEEGESVDTTGKTVMSSRKRSAKEAQMKGAESGKKLRKKSKITIRKEKLRKPKFRVKTK